LCRCFSSSPRTRIVAYYTWNLYSVLCWMQSGCWMELTRSSVSSRARRHHAAAVVADGLLYTWGHGRHGELGHTCIHIYIWEYKYIYIGSFAAMLKLMWDHEPCEYCGLYPGREQLRITPGTFTVHCPVCSRMMSNFLDHHNRDRTAWEFFGGLRPWNFPAD